MANIQGISLGSWPVCEKQKLSTTDLKEIASVFMGANVMKKLKLEFYKLDKAVKRHTLTPLINVRIANYSIPFISIVTETYT